MVTKFLYYVTLNRKGQWFISMEEIHVTLVYESAEISSFLMILNSRLSVVFIKLFILINEKIIFFFVHSCIFSGKFTNSWMGHDHQSISVLEPSFC